jgi:hypothetical protein
MPMSEVKDVHGSTGDVSEGPGAEDSGQGDPPMSGYLCGVCEEPLPYGATACVACETPVAPLDDDELVAGPYEITGDGTQPADPAEGHVDPGVVGDEPIGTDRALGAPTVPILADPPAAETGPVESVNSPGGPPLAAGSASGEPPAPQIGAAESVEEPPVLTPPKPLRADLLMAPQQPSAPPPPSPVSVSGHDAYSAYEPVGETANGTASANGTPGTDPTASPPLTRQVADPASLIGVDRPEYPEPAVADPGPDPMLGRGPTTPLLPPPPRRASDTTGAGSSGRGGNRSAAAVLPLLAGGCLMVLALVAVVMLVMNRSGSEDDVATASTTAAPAATAPTPTTVADRNGSPTQPAEPAEPKVYPEVAAVSAQPPSSKTFCVAAEQFKIDSDPDSVARKFLDNPVQLLVAIEALVHNAPADTTRSAVEPLRDTVSDLAARVEQGEITTIAGLRAATDPDTGRPAWPRFDQVVLPAASKHCPGLT